MIPIRVSLAGFLSYRERQELFFAGAPLWVLSGPNATGKSTVFDAITFALYGKARDGVRPSDLLNHGSDRLEVEFDFALEDRVYRVRRIRPRRGAQTVGACRLLDAASSGEGAIEPIEDTDSVDGLNRWVRETIRLKFEAFTASILLRQGKSDRLLEVAPRDRFDILAELIDLSEYQRLYDRVDSQRREFAGSERGYATMLIRQPQVDAAELTAAHETLRLVETELRDAREQADQLSRLYYLAQQWEEVIAALSALEDQGRTDETLLGRADEIEHGRKRWEELGQVLPHMERVVIGQARVVESNGRLNELDCALAELEPQVQAATDRANDARARANEMDQELEAWTDKLTTLAQKHGQLVHLLLLVEELERAETHIAAVETELAAIPYDLDDRVNVAEAEASRLDSLAKELPTIEDFVATRIQLITRLNDKAAAMGFLDDTNEPWEELEQRFATADAALSAATQAEAAAAMAHATTHERHCACAERRDRFAQAADDARCSVCGQPITAKHAAEERQRLNAEWDQTKRALEEAHKAKQQAREWLNACGASLEAIETERDALARRRGELLHDIELAQCRVADEMSDLERNFVRLSPGRQTLVSSVPMVSPEDWLSTSYPTAKDVEEIREEAASVSAVVQERDGLRKLVTDRCRAEDQRRENLTRIDELEIAHGRAALLSARKRQAMLAEEEADVVAQRDETRSRRDEARTAVEEWQAIRDDHYREFKRLADCRYETETAIRFETAECDTALARLPVAWRPVAKSAADEEVERWRQEFVQYAEHPRLWEDLLQARSRREEFQLREAEWHKKLGEVPPAARRPSADVERDLCESSKREHQANEAYLAEVRKLADLEARKRLREETESLHRAAGRQCHLHATLANLLGRNGLQLFLLRRSETAIVAHANEILDRLTSGRMRLRLRTEDASAVDRALDLIFDDVGTGAEGMTIELSSGSQRFRIALSLALGIGQYLGQETRHARSVIIDEGFGSLDRMGRASMIQELTRLQSELQRIILVSHQEEIAEAFPNGYSFALVDGASRVSMTHQD